LRSAQWQSARFVDDACVVCSSHNWLSNRRFRNREKSFIIDDVPTANATFRELAPLVAANPA
jgi:hypothetical protein